MNLSPAGPAELLVTSAYEVGISGRDLDRNQNVGNSGRYSGHGYSARPLRRSGPRRPVVPRARIPSAQKTFWLKSIPAISVTSTPMSSMAGSPHWGGKDSSAPSHSRKLASPGAPRRSLERPRVRLGLVPRPGSGAGPLQRPLVGRRFRQAATASTTNAASSARALTIPPSVCVPGAGRRRHRCPGRGCRGASRWRLRRSAGRRTRGPWPRSAADRPSTVSG